MRYGHGMETTRMMFARAVNVRLEQIGLSKGEFATKLGISQATLSNRLAGRRRLDTDHMDSMAQALGFKDAFAFIAYAKSLDEMAAA